MILRDSHGIAQVSHVTGSKILRMLKKAGAWPPRASRLAHAHPSRAPSHTWSVTNADVSPLLLLLAGLSPDIPEDLYCLIKKAVQVRKHLDKFRQDKDAKFRLILIESRIHRTARYYKTVKALPPNWKYESSTASTLVS